MRCTFVTKHSTNMWCHDTTGAICNFFGGVKSSECDVNHYSLIPVPTEHTFNALPIFIHAWKIQTYWVNTPAWTTTFHLTANLHPEFPWCNSRTADRLRVLATVTGVSCIYETLLHVPDSLYQMCVLCFFVTRRCLTAAFAHIKIYYTFHKDWYGTVKH
jgi:hypothetical protein